MIWPDYDRIKQRTQKKGDMIPMEVKTKWKILTQKRRRLYEIISKGKEKTQR
jgi:hypothetical protein